MITTLYNSHVLSSKQYVQTLCSYSTHLPITLLFKIVNVIEHMHRITMENQTKSRFDLNLRLMDHTL